MISSILNSTKKVLNIDFAYTDFDQDIITHINAVFSVVNQLGLGPADGFIIEDDSTDWADYDILPNQLSLLKTYLYLKVRMLFDPPSTSYLITAMEKQIAEYEWRLSMLREDTIPYVPNDPVLEGEVVW